MKTKPRPKSKRLSRQEFEARARAMADARNAAIKAIWAKPKVMIDGGGRGIDDPRLAEAGACMAEHDNAIFKFYAEYHPDPRRRRMGQQALMDRLSPPTASMH